MRARRSTPLLSVLGCMLALIVAGCGSRGYAPALGASARATLTETTSHQAVANVALVPFDAMRIAAYYRGVALPLTGAQTPAIVRSGGCLGPVVAALTDGVPSGLATQAAAATTATVAAQSAPALAATLPDPSGGLDIALAPSADWYVAVLERANDPSARVVACGHPLTGRRQYFDLYPPNVGSSGVARGTALLDPIVATRVTFTPSSAHSIAGATRWEVRNGGCAGTVLASAPLASTPTAALTSLVVFHPLDSAHWWVTLTLAHGANACGQVSGA